VQDVPDHRQFDRRGDQKLVVEVTRLPAAVGEQGQAGQAGL